MLYMRQKEKLRTQSSRTSVEAQRHPIRAWSGLATGSQKLGSSNGSRALQPQED